MNQPRIKTPEALVQELVRRGWVNDPQLPPQSNSAQAFAFEFLARRPNIVNDEYLMFVELSGIILDHNNDPHDTDVIGTVIALLDYIWNRVL